MTFLLWTEKRAVMQQPFSIIKNLFCCEVIEVTLDQDDRSTLITGTGCKVT